MAKNIILFCLIFLFILWFDYYYLLQSGNIGVVGNQGLIGPPGIIGKTGTQGISTNNNKILNMNITYNPIGPRGKQGSIGPVGPIGPVGYRGSRGQTGPIGSAGPVGLIGLPGPAGQMGVPGKDVEWHLSLIDRNNCLDAIYNDILGYSSCPENTVMIGLENDFNKYKIKCCSLINDIESQNTKYEIIKKGGSVNPLNIYDY
jgi:hypothetical protein